MENKPLSGKAAIITGAGSGIGKAIALKFAENGASIALDGRTRSKLESVREIIEAQGGTADVFPFDVSETAECIELVKSAVERFGRLDILVNNATFTGRHAVKDMGPRYLWESQSDRLDNSFKVNILAPFILAREAMPHMKKQGIGYIINIGALQSLKLYPGGHQYSATKTAMRALSITLSKEIRTEADIRVSVLHPGGTASEWVAEVAAAGKLRSTWVNARMIATEEIADAALFLATRTGNGVVDELAMRRQDADYWCCM